MKFFLKKKNEKKQDMPGFINASQVWYQITYTRTLTLFNEGST